MVSQFLDDGWAVFATTRSPGRMAGNTDRLSILPYNVAIHQERRMIVEAIHDQCPQGLGCLVNNAGYGLAGPLETLDETQIRQQFEVNFFAPLFLMQELLPSLRKAKGRIINISSVLGFTGMPMQSLYASSKFALEGLSESLYYELSDHGVQISLVEPGGFRTGFADGMDSPAEHRFDVPLYRQQFSGYRHFLKKVSTERKGKPPGDVAKRVLALANSPAMPLRVRIGQDAQALYYLRRALPQKLADKMLRRIGSNILKAKPNDSH